MVSAGTAFVLALHLGHKVLNDHGFNVFLRCLLHFRILPQCQFEPWIHSRAYAKEFFAERNVPPIQDQLILQVTPETPGCRMELLVCEFFFLVAIVA